MIEGDRSPRAYVAVCGPADATEEERALAEEVGRRLAEADAVVLCGGLDGVMDAVARGTAKGGGISIGLLPGEDRADAGTNLTLSLPTGMGEIRNALLVRAADVVIAISGEFGTLSEIAFALRTQKPVVGLDTWELAKAGEPVDAFVRARTPEEAVERSLELARGS
ncbi:MAG TPA: TIGR00725 family protein [Actinomycetota bacterium]|nr:TIGR00725 family protein [Actinomycetota bacterium]